MIPSNDLTIIGHVNKPHGIKGEVSITLDDPAIDPARLSCLIMNREGLPVPFFAESVRGRKSLSWLVKLGGIDSETDARAISGDTIWALAHEVDRMLEDEYGDDYDAEEPDNDESGFYANDLIGMRVIADGTDIGTVTEIDAATANILMIVTDADGAERMIPVAAEFFDEVDTENNVIKLTLPQGLI